MSVARLLPVTDGDPLRALQEFLSAWWERNEIQAMLAPTQVKPGSAVKVEAIVRRDELDCVDPLAPVISGNAASLLDEFSREHGTGKIAVVLRPCELRALVEMRKRKRTTPAVDATEVIGVDCLCCYPAGEYLRKAREGQAGSLLKENLEYASEGGLTPERLRTACQLCDWPAPVGADLAIGLLGVDTNTQLFLIARDESTDLKIHLAEIVPARVPEDAVVRREMAIAAISEKRARQRDRLTGSFPNFFGDLGSALSPFVNCSLCGDCLQACPLYHGELAGMLATGGMREGRRPVLAELVELARWLSSCSGCGSCEDACPQDVPVMALVSCLSHGIRDGLHYRAGDPDQPLPWLVS